MEEHPIPQQISAFEFKLVGEMTLKQFGFLAGFLIFAWIFYATPLPGFLKWPIVLLFVFLGLAFAFIPVEERNLATWLLNFIHSIFRPTLRIWQKEEAIPEFLLTVPKTIPLVTKPSVDILESRRRLKEYLESLPVEPKTTLDLAEEKFLQSLDFAAVLPVAVMPAPIPVAAPPKMVEVPLTAFAETPVARPFLPKFEEKFEEKPRLVEIKPMPQVVLPLASEINFTQPVIAIKLPGETPKYIPEIIEKPRKLHSLPTGAIPVYGERRFEISEELRKRFGPEEVEPQLEEITPTPPPVPPVPPVQPTVVPQPEPDKPKVSVNQRQRLFKPVRKFPEQPKLVIETGEIQVQKPPPIKILKAKPVSPTTQTLALTSLPNALSGTTWDPAGNFLEGAVVVIKNNEGVPVRALKTNRLGQFVMATPLPNGVFTIETEDREGKFKFDIIQIEISGEILEPIEIKATAHATKT